MTAIPNITTIIGNLTADPELRHTQDGTAVANFSVASTPRVADGQGGFKDGETVFYRVAAWRRDAENVKATLSKGDRVVVIAEAKPNNYEKDGVTINAVQYDAKEIAASLSFATAVITRNAKGTNQTPPAQYAQQPAAPAQPVAQAAPVQAAPAQAAPVYPAQVAPAAPVQAPVYAAQDDFS